MTKEKLISLQKHRDAHKSRLADLTTKVPDKHKNRVESYKNYLNREIKMITTKLDEAAMAATPNAK